MNGINIIYETCSFMRCSFQFVHEKEIVAEDDQVFLMKLQV